MTGIRIRPATAADAPGAAALLRASITDLCSADHGGDPAKIAAWTANKTPENVESWITTSLCFVAEGQGALAGFGAASPEGVVLLNYVAPACRHQGVSRALLRRLEAELAARGLTPAKLISTETALAFYLAEGWQADGPAQMGRAVQGYPMAKTLPTIRRLSPEDVGIWRAIRLEALATAPQAFSSRHADWVDRPLADFAARLDTAAIFAAWAGGTLAGCAALTPDTEDRHRAWVESVFVRPASRGKGVADSLMAAIVNEARDQGLTDLLLDVGAANGPARKTYQRAGFDRLGDRPPGSNDACEITMRLKIGQPSF